MRVEELDFELPIELLATRPRELEGEKRHDSRLLVMDRATGSIHHRRFYDLPEYLRPGDTLVLNDSRTLNANLYGVVEGIGRVELQLRSHSGDDLWQVACRPWKEPVLNARIDFGDSRISAVVEGKREDLPLWLVRFTYSGDFEAILAEIGRPIMSPYVEKVFDNSYYNTVYARNPGSVEMPAAGRHFTPELLTKIRDMGVHVAYITLHVGLSSVDIKTENVEDHEMHEEYFSISPETAELLNETRRRGNRLIIVGTTVMRCLESAANEEGLVEPGAKWTRLFIYPGHRFKTADAFITNFHGPRSTRIALAAAFTGKELLVKGYREAIEQRYRFYEFGDATLTI